jgi:hypothetical protein
MPWQQSLSLAICSDEENFVGVFRPAVCSKEASRALKLRKHVTPEGVVGD